MWIAFSIFICIPIASSILIIDMVKNVLVKTVAAVYDEIRDVWVELAKYKPEFTRKNFNKKKKRNNLAT